MDISKLKRNPKVIHDNLQKVKGGSYIAKKECKIYIPEKYKQKRLARFAEHTYILSIYAIVIGDEYGVGIAPTMIKTAPSTVINININDVPYLELVYEPGDQVVVSTMVLKDDTLLYPIWDEFITLGNVPWFINYEDLGGLFQLSQKYTGINIGANHAIVEMIAAIISKDPNNLNKQYRHFIEKMKQIETDPPKVIKLKDVTYGATNTTTKLIGAYWNDGLNSALVNPSTSNEGIEDLLRK